MNGVLPAAVAAAARGQGLIYPGGCGGEAAWFGSDVDILAAPSLRALINHFSGTQNLTPPDAKVREEEPNDPDLTDVKGQETAKRSLEIAAGGGYNVLMVGPPDSGKFTLASRLQDYCRRRSIRSRFLK